MSPFVGKNWKDANTFAGGGDQSTPLSAAALEDLETRLSDYSDDVAADSVSRTSSNTITASHTIQPASATDPSLQFKPSGGDVAHAPIVLSVGKSTFDGTVDPVGFFGYNRGPSAKVDATEPMVYWGIEADYDTGPYQALEAYLELVSEDDSQTARPFFVHAKRDATNPTDFLISVALQGDPVSIVGKHADYNDGGAPVFHQFGGAYHTVLGVAGVDATVEVEAVAGRNANIALGVDGTDRNFIISTAGSLNRTVIQQNTRHIINVYSTPNGAPGAAISVGGSDDNRAVITADVNDSNAAVKGIVARGKSGQSGHLIEAQDDSENSLFRVEAAGKVYASGEIEIDGALNHDGSTVGFFGVAPAVRASAYTPSNVTTDRTYNANATTLDEIADVLGTLIGDLQGYGLLQ